MVTTADSFHQRTRSLWSHKNWSLIYVFTSVFSLPNTDCRYVADVNQAQKRECVVVNKRTAVAMERLCIYLEKTNEKSRIDWFKILSSNKITSSRFLLANSVRSLILSFFRIRNSGQKECN